MHITWLQRVVKRLIDLVLSISAIVLLSPLLALLSVAILIVYGRPIFYIAKRIGGSQRIFNHIKFRTMTNDQDASGSLLPDEERLRPFGRWLRRTSLDELPQLINVIQGHMSIVGPRAIPVSFLANMDSKFTLRLEAKPGLTGWTQVRYQGKERTWDEKYSVDLEYIDNYSLILDIKIIFMTFSVLARRYIHNKTGESLSSQKVISNEKHN